LSQATCIAHPNSKTRGDAKSHIPTGGGWSADEQKDGGERPEAACSPNELRSGCEMGNRILWHRHLLRSSTAGQATANDQAIGIRVIDIDGKDPP
jgi:hypothetical protein